MQKTQNRALPNLMNSKIDDYAEMINDEASVDTSFNNTLHQGGKCTLCIVLDGKKFEHLLWQLTYTCPSVRYLSMKCILPHFWLIISVFLLIIQLSRLLFSVKHSYVTVLFLCFLIHLKVSTLNFEPSYVLSHKSCMLNIVCA